MKKDPTVLEVKADMASRYRYAVYEVQGDTAVFELSSGRFQAAERWRKRLEKQFPSEGWVVYDTVDGRVVSGNTAYKLVIPESAEAPAKPSEKKKKVVQAPAKKRVPLKRGKVK